MKSAKSHPGYHSLSKRIVFQFCFFTLVLSVVYGSLTFLFMYIIEDGFIEKDMITEANYLSSQYELTGTWPESQNRSMQLHFSRDTFPEDFRDLAKEEPERSEFYGQEGRHYHVLQFSDYPGTFLVAEVSDDLQVRHIRTGIITFLIISATLVALIACLLAWLIARKTIKPLNQLADLVDDVAVENIPKNFAGQFPLNEVGILANTLEQSLKRISKAIEREKHFTRDVSHELRTPLAVIKNAIELSKNKQEAGQANLAIFDRIYEAAEQMEKTVQTLLMLAREEHENTEKPQIELMPIVEKSILNNHLLLNDKEVEINLNDNCMVSLSADPDMLKVLLDNLLSNAFQYTEQGEVSISFNNNTLIIQDTGPGIEQDIQTNVTNAGVKGNQSTGFGFGLSIVKRLCEHQGWAMSVKSEQGTIVSVSF